MHGGISWIKKIGFYSFKHGKETRQDKRENNNESRKVAKMSKKFGQLKLVV